MRWTPEDVWSEHDRYPVTDWASEVIDRNTRVGYIEWVNSQIEQESDDADL